MIQEKKEYVILTFRNTTSAIAMEKRCRMSGIPGRLMPVPREISASCGTAWRMQAEEYEQYRESIEKTGIEMEKTVRMLL